MQKFTAILLSWPRLLALLAGGISATGFAPLNLWFLTLLCFALLIYLVASAEAGKRAFLLGWLFGLGHFSIGNNWIATAFTYQANMPAWLGWLAVPLLALYLAVYPALGAWGAWWIKKRVGGGVAAVTFPFILAFAGCWIITEWLRSWVFTGFAWNPLGVVLLGSSYADFAQEIGTYGVSGLFVLLAGFIAVPAGKLKEANDRYSDTPSQASLAAETGSTMILAIAAAVIFAVFIFPIFVQPPPDKKQVDGPWLTIVQPNISQIDKHTPGYEAINFSRLAQLSHAKYDVPRILLWPESAVPWWLEDGYPPQAYWNQPGGTAAGTRATLVQLLGPDDILLTGGDRLEFGKTGEVVGARNSVMAIDPKGEIKAHYDKAHLVPYGEYLALRWLLEPLGAARLVPGTIDFWPGPGARTLSLGAGKPKVGLQICYEMIFSGQVVDRTNRPDFIFNPSNDAWFGSWGPPQHLAQARLRAIEEGLPVVRSTPTGISAVIDADGHILKNLRLGTSGRIDALLPMPKTPTLFARYGNVLPVSFAALLIALSFLPLARRRLSR